MDINVTGRPTGHVVIERGNHGKVVLEIQEAKQVLSKLPRAITAAEQGMTEEERQRQIKEYEEKLAQLRAADKIGEFQPVIRMGRNKEGGGIGENKEKT